jgi:cytidylate kinase
MKLQSLKLIFKPSYWLMNHGYSAAWDKALNELLDEHTFKNIGEHTAQLGHLTIWIENHPYASFTVWHGAPGSVRPSRLTIERARNLLERDMFRPPEVVK